MLHQFVRDRRGNYLMITALVMPVLFGSLTIGVEYTEMSRQCKNTVNAVDAATFATARRLLEGIPENDAQTYARNFFNANLSAAAPEDVNLTITLPDWKGLRQLSLHSVLTYKPHFLGAFLGLLGQDQPLLQCQSTSTVQMQNTVEAVLVLDNTASMLTDPKTGKYKVAGGTSRLDLLKSAATQLVDKLADVASVMAQIEKPVQIAVVPFAASVNVGSDYGPDKKNAKWLDTEGRSSIHHENLDWSMVNAHKRSKFPNDKWVEKDELGRFVKKGVGWLDKEGDVVTRFSLLKELTRYSCSGNASSCTSPTLTPVKQEWGGCVEARPFPYSTTDELPSSARPDTLFVPMFAPDEAGDYKGTTDGVGTLVNQELFSPKSNVSQNIGNSWWDDSWDNAVVSQQEALGRQRNGYKYFIPLPVGSPNESGRLNGSPNLSCATNAITPLADISTDSGKDSIMAAIESMQAGGNTNVPEGLAWGWRVLSSQEPFTEGRSELERGNDKVIILLTDGANTYDRGNAIAGNRSTYAAYGYGYLAHEDKYGRIFDAAGTPPTAHPPAESLNFPVAMNDTFLKICTNANGGDTGTAGAGLIIMTVALDLSEKISSEKKQIEMLEKCASQARFSKKKLFWNAKSADLEDVFRQISDELSNMRLIN